MLQKEKEKGLQHSFLFLFWKRTERKKCEERWKVKFFFSSFWMIECFSPQHVFQTLDISFIFSPWQYDNTVKSRGLPQLCLPARRPGAWSRALARFLSPSIFSEVKNSTSSKEGRASYYSPQAINHKHPKQISDSPKVMPKPSKGKMEVPSDEMLVAAISAIRADNPTMGREKLKQKLQRENKNWEITGPRFKQILLDFGLDTEETKKQREISSKYVLKA